MVKIVKNISKKIVILTLIICMICMYFPALSLVSFAAENITSLDTPTNLIWKDGSTATATWNEVEKANYYNVIVNVYNTNNELIGSRNTGTSNNEIDLQQEINDINYNYKLNKIAVSFLVQATYIDDTTSIVGKYSEESIKYIIEKKGSIKLDTPINVSLDDNYNATWNIDTTNFENIKYFNIYYKIKYQDSIKTGYLGLFNPSSTPARDPEFGMTITDGKATANIKNKLATKYKDLGYNGQTIEISYYVVSQADSNSTVYLDSDNSEYSNSVNYKNEGIIKLPTPTNISLDDNYNATWDIDTTNFKNIKYFNIYYKIKYQDSVKTGYLGLFNPSSTPARDPEFGMTITDGKATANIKNKLATKYKELGYNGQTIEISYYVVSQADSNSTVYLDSDNSEYSNSVNFKNDGITKLPTPTNVSLDDDYNATWDIDTTNFSNIKYFNIYYKIKYQDSIKTGYLGLFNPSSTPARDPEFGMTITDGKATANIKNKLATKYKELGYNGQTIEISYYVVSQADSNSSMYLDSNNSEYSNSNYYSSAGSTKINSITLSPNKPVIAVGRTLYIGKTIEPNNAIYDKINWSTSDNSIVSINDMGQITGIKKGNATITAQINNATQDAEVSVYEIESNINDSKEANQVINEANNVIEAVITDGDITNTDIDDKETVVNEIEQGAQNGDKFNVDIKYDEKNVAEYNNIKDIIDSKYDEYNIAGGNDIKIAISHTDDKGLEHHIANITELESEINVEFEMPNNMPKLAKTKKREYKLVRFHNENIEDVDFEISNGKIETSSDKFSDFVLLYKDTDLPTFNLSGTITSYNSETDDITIQLYKTNETEAFDEKNVKGNSTNYSFENVPVGDYIVKLSKNNHVTREYSITVDNSNINLDTKICLIGDINGDGKINIKDWNIMYEHINETSEIKDYSLLCADVNNDGKVNIKDWNRLYDHITEVNPIV